MFGRFILAQTLLCSSISLCAEEGSQPEQVSKLPLLEVSQAIEAKIAEDDAVIETEILTKKHATGLNRGKSYALRLEQGLLPEALVLYERALEIREKKLGSDHPGVAATLNSMAFLLQSQGKYSETRLHYERALEIRDSVASHSAIRRR